MASDTLTTPAEPPAELGQVGQATKPACDLSDIDVGDRFRALLRVTTVLDRNGQIERASAFWKEAMRCKRYDQVLTMAREYVEVVV